jgi:hypothetical protein
MSRTSPPPMDSSNKFQVVGFPNGDVAITRPPSAKRRITREAALNLAAWLLALADDEHEPHDHRTFKQLLQKIETAP